MKRAKYRGARRAVKPLREEKIELFRMQLEIILSECSNNEMPTKKELGKKMGVSERQFYRYLRLVEVLRLQHMRDVE